MVDNKEIGQIVNKIVIKFKPDKVVLFGSYVWGKPTPDSDADLLIIKESNQPRAERERELQQILADRSTPLDFLVYTPDELAEKINQERNLFLEDITRNGKVLYSRPGSPDVPLQYSRPLVIVP